MAAGEGSREHPPRAARPPSELRLRVISALVLGIVAILATHAGGWASALLWLSAGLAVAAEWIAMTGAAPRGRLQAIAGIGLSLLVAAVLLRSSAALAGALAALVVVALLATAAGRRDRLWSVAGFGCAAVIALIPTLVREDPGVGAVGLIWMFAVVWTTDIVAYFTGRAIGGPKLWPAVSPKKTWSGFAGGLLAGTLAGTVVLLVAERGGWALPAPLTGLVLLSAVASVAGQAGDLAEAPLKRRCGVKDSGRIIPGHGGVMDRLDAFWAVAVLAGLGLLVRAS